MQFKNIKELISPLLKAGHEWQYIDINGQMKKPFLYFSNIQWILFVVSVLVLFRLKQGISSDLIGYVMSAFSISVSLFMSLLVSIFDKFENTDFAKNEKTENEIHRLIRKKNFFTRFISITSYLVVQSILIIALCSLTYIFDISKYNISTGQFVTSWDLIDIKLTLRNMLVITYRIALNYFLLNYLLLTFFITGSAFDYYMAEMKDRRIQ